MRRSWWIFCFALSRSSYRIPSNHGVVAGSSPASLNANSPRETAFRFQDDTTTSTCLGSSSDDSVTESKRISKSSALDMQSYHLIWSPGACKKIAITTASLFAVKLFQNTLQTILGSALSVSWGTPVLRPLASVASNVLLPLFASACCLLQLWINILAGGCAGFNTYLGPVRPFFLSLLFYLTISTFGSKQWAVKSLLRWSIALLPEGLDTWNRYQERKQAPYPLGRLEARVELDIPTMGCVACINTIDRHLRQTNGVVEAASSLNPLGLKGGQATVRLRANSQKEIDEMVATVTQSVEEAGFKECQVLSVRTLELES